MNRGDVVIVQFPYADGRKGKNRPAVVVQNDLENKRLTNTIIAMVTGITRNAHLPTQAFLDPADPDGKASGVFGPSAVKATTLYTIQQREPAAGRRAPHRRHDAQGQWGIANGSRFGLIACAAVSRHAVQD